jgi:hypothetical protein
MSFAKEVWTNLAAIDCSDKVSKKMNLSYLSWAWAWAQLMNSYPESEYDFLEPVIDESGSVEIWCAVTVKDGEKSLKRMMWLPVMDHKNNSIIKPSSRQISDTRMRCLTKCLAMFGLGHYIYAGEDLPDPEVAAEAEKAKYEALTDSLSATIDVIKESIESGDYSAGSEAWQELTEDEKMGLWKAPSKGGCFTTQEREVMKSPEFRKALSGE